MKARMSALEGSDGFFLDCLFKIGSPAPKRRDY
jgi:hypothetical protein